MGDTPKSSSRVAIAAAVRAALLAANAAGTLSKTFAVARKYVPAAELKDLGTLTLTIVPSGPEKRAPYDRARVRKDYSIEIGIQQRIAQTTDPESESGNAEIDALMLFAEQVADFFDPINGTPADLAATGAKWAGCEIDPPYDVEHLRQHRVFTSRVILTFFYL